MVSRNYYTIDGCILKLLYNYRMWYLIEYFLLIWYLIEYLNHPLMISIDMVLDRVFSLTQLNNYHYIYIYILILLS